MIWGSPILRNLHRVFFPTCLLNSFDFLMADLSHTLRFRCGVQDGKLPISTANLWPEKKCRALCTPPLDLRRSHGGDDPFISPSSALHHLQFEVDPSFLMCKRCHCYISTTCLWMSQGDVGDPPVKSSRSCGAPVTTAALTPQLVSFRHCPNWFRLIVRLSQNQGRQTGEWLA